MESVEVVKGIVKTIKPVHAHCMHVELFGFAHIHALHATRCTISAGDTIMMAVDGERNGKPRVSAYRNITNGVDGSEDLKSSALCWLLVVVGIALIWLIVPLSFVKAGWSGLRENSRIRRAVTRLREEEASIDRRVENGNTEADWTIDYDDARAREPFGMYRYRIRRNGLVVARYWHDHRGEEHGIEFANGVIVDWPVGRMSDFVEGGGPEPRRLSTRAIAFLAPRRLFTRATGSAGAV